jgi:hypothetical protein
VSAAGPDRFTDDADVLAGMRVGARPQHLGNDPTRVPSDNGHVE